MNEAVDCGESHRGILENVRPLTERMIRRHHQTTPFVAGSDQLEQDGCLSLILPHVANVVENQQMVFVELVDRALQRQRLPGLRPPLHQLDRSGWARSVKVCHMAAMVGSRSSRSSNGNRAVSTLIVSPVLSLTRLLPRTGGGRRSWRPGEA